MNTETTNTTNNTVELTKKMKATLEIINAAYENPGMVSRAQIQSLVDAGSFKWPYWITDHKHGYAVGRGLFVLPTADAKRTVKPAKKANKSDGAVVVEVAPEPVLPKQYTIVDPKNGKPVTFTAMDASEALGLFVAARKRVKKSFSFATVDSFTESAIA